MKKQMFLVAIMAAAVSVMTSCSESNDAVINPDTQAEVIDAPTTGYVQDPKQEFVCSLIDSTYNADNEEVDLQAFETFICGRTGMSLPDVYALEDYMQAVIQNDTIQSIVAEIKPIIRGKTHFTQGDIDEVQGICRAHGLSEEYVQAFARGMKLAENVVNLVSSSVERHFTLATPYTRAGHVCGCGRGPSCGAAQSAQSAKSVLCNLAAGVLGGIVGAGVEGSLAAAGGAGAATGGVGALIVGTGILAGAIGGYLITAIWCS